MIGESTRGTGKTLANDLNVRQLNGIGKLLITPPHHEAQVADASADGLTAPLEKESATKQFGSNTDAFLNTVDGQGTDDSAEAGAIVGDEELDIGQEVGGSNGQNGGGSPPPPPQGHKKRQNSGGDVAAQLESFGQTLGGQAESDLKSATELGRRQLNGMGECWKSLGMSDGVCR